MSIIIFLIVLAVLILVHEFGHFIVAKKSGTRVDEFGLGFPPRLFGVKKGETLYSFNAIPFGGFVKIFGENPEDVSAERIQEANERGEKVETERAFTSKSRWIQAAIIAAGVFFNVLLAWILISVGFMTGLPMPVGSAPAGTVVEDAVLTVTGVEAGSPAEEAGLIPGDKLLRVKTREETITALAIPAFQSFIKAHGGEEIVLTYARGEETFDAALVPTRGIIADQPAIGIGMDMVGIVSLPPHRAFWEGGKLTVVLTGAVAAGFANLIADAFTGEAALSNLTGPVGIVGLVGDAAQFGFVYLLGFTAFISINLAIINLLPLPALDGGRLFFLLIEVLKGSPMNPKVINTVHAAGFALLILLMLVVTYNDIVRLLD